MIFALRHRQSSIPRLRPCLPILPLVAQEDRSEFDTAGPEMQRGLSNRFGSRCEGDVRHTREEVGSFVPSYPDGSRGKSDHGSVEPAALLYGATRHRPVGWSTRPDDTFTGTGMEHLDRFGVRPGFGSG